MGILKLSKSDRELLFEYMRKHKNYNIRKQAHVILLKSKNYDNVTLANLFEMEEERICEWIVNWRKFHRRAFVTRNLWFNTYEPVLDM